MGWKSFTCREFLRCETKPEIRSESSWCYRTSPVRVADDVKTDLIATVSHELKTPLTSMQMAVLSDVGGESGTLNPKQTELLWRPGTTRIVCLK